MIDFITIGDCEGCKFEDAMYDEEPCCYCRRNPNIVDEYIENDDEK